MLRLFRDGFREGECLQIQKNGFMNKTERRNNIIRLLETADGPLSGSEIARQLGVSRQVIVQDIALLRADHREIVATARGYVLKARKDSVSREIWVSHSPDQIEEELNLIVDQGGTVRDVIVKHPIYGRLRGELNLSNRREVAEFVEKIKVTGSQPLLTHGDGVHAHTVEAEDEETLDVICGALKKAGFLLEKLKT